MHILFVEFKNRVSDNNLNNYITHWHEAFAGLIAVVTPLSLLSISRNERVYSILHMFHIETNPLYRIGLNIRILL